MKDLPIIGEAAPVANFAKKEKVSIPASLLKTINIPPIFYWEDVQDGKSYLMTMAFQWHGQNYGLSYPISDDSDRSIDIMRRKLFAVVKETLDVLIHHGTKVVDQYGNVNPKLVNDEEAIRYRLDPMWRERVAAFNKLVRV